MEAITIDGLSLQFDADQITSGNKKEQALAAIDLINLELQRSLTGLVRRFCSTLKMFKFLREGYLIVRY